MADKVNRRIDLMNSVQAGTVPEDDKLERIMISGDGEDVRGEPQPPLQPQQATAPHPSGYGRTVQRTDLPLPPDGYQ